MKDVFLTKKKIKIKNISYGTAVLGNYYDIYGNKQVSEVLNHAYESGINYFDTAPWYGLGRSEHRIGNALREIDRNKFILSTKVGRILSTNRPVTKPLQEYAFWQDENKPFDGSLKFYVKFDYSYDGILRSYEDSVQRIGFSKIDMLVIHDLDFFYHEDGITSGSIKK